MPTLLKDSKVTLISGTKTTPHFVLIYFLSANIAIDN